MKREIKFKFWLGRTQKMTYEHSLIDIAHLFWDFPEDIIPLQFTGQTDCNGVEIYEGDIIEIITISDRRRIVEFVKSAFRMTSGKLTWYLHDFKSEEEIKVIGNKYENPELLPIACVTQKC